MIIHSIFELYQTFSHHLFGNILHVLFMAPTPNRIYVMYQKVEIIAVTYRLISKIVNFSDNMSG